MRMVAGLVFLLATSTVPGSSLAQTSAAAPAPKLVSGASVYDPAGDMVGTIESVVGDIVVVSTGTSKASLAKSAFGAGPKGPIVAVTRAQLDAAAAQAAASASAALRTKLVVGAPIHGASGAVIGTVKGLADQAVDLTTQKGDVRLPMTAFTIGAAGDVIIGMTAEQFDAAVAAAKSGSGAP